jgi:hypothetical protein
MSQLSREACDIVGRMVADALFAGSADGRVAVCEIDRTARDVTAPTDRIRRCELGDGLTLNLRVDDSRPDLLLQE